MNELSFAITLTGGIVYGILLGAAMVWALLATTGGVMGDAWDWLEFARNFAFVAAGCVAYGWWLWMGGRP